MSNQSNKPDVLFESIFLLTEGSEPYILSPLVALFFYLYISAHSLIKHIVGSHAFSSAPLSVFIFIFIKIGLLTYVCNFMG